MKRFRPVAKVVEYENYKEGSHLEITSGVEQQVRRFQIPMQNIGRMNVFETTKDLQRMSKW